MLHITPSIQIRKSELRFEYVRASGPGGQNVNKAATAAQLRFDARASSLPEDVKSRLIRLAGKRATDDGVLLIEAKQFRTQEQNREDAIQRLITLIKKALIIPKSRKQTKPTKMTKEKRLIAKKRRGALKQSRQSGSFEGE
ncbi:MAG: alternative ribosome rescue aminoacyl-tRNA hydrolase ArfB [Anaerolineaceae bacterium]|jgi:ribosome-associated protein|nr:alternative ribosome rescue aminoacyl-tRNA hydrolase ArfB [Anaerolineaceae bacterium]OQY88537.1 MAG: aminoacyl-tRNA hydrolase [Anaerolineae bacterium UTCFX1]